MEAKNNRLFARLKPNLIISIILALIMMVSLCIFAGRIMEYNELKKEREAIESRIAEREAEIAALEHEYNAEMDDAYVESVARSKLGLVGPDEIIVYDDYYSDN